MSLSCFTFYPVILLFFIAVRLVFYVVHEEIAFVSALSAACGAGYDTLTETVEEHEPAYAGERIGADDVETDHKTDAEAAVLYAFLP